MAEPTHYYILKINNKGTQSVMFYSSELLKPISIDDITRLIYAQEYNNDINLQNVNTSTTEILSVENVSQTGLPALLKDNIIMLTPRTSSTEPIMAPLPASLGGTINSSIRILGRDRKIYREGRKQFIIYKKQKMTLNEARKLEKQAHK